MYAGVAALLRTPAARLGVPRLSAGTTSPANLARQTLSFARQRRPLHLGSSHLSSSPAPSENASTDPKITTEANTAVKAKLSRTNLARNNEIRYAYRDKTPETEAAVEKMLGTAYIPPVRRYPTAESTALSLQRARRVARIRVGEEMLARKGGRVRRRDAADTLGLLKNMTQSRDRKPVMHAMRIVLPREWELDVPSGKNVNFVEARTGLAARLRMTSDHENATAVVLRGQGPVLAKAADEIIAVCKDVEIFKLGEVTSLNYAAQRLWPIIEDAEDGGAVVPPGQLENIWLHKEQQYWIDSAYEKTPRPEEWTKLSFDTFIKSLVYGRLKPGLPRPVYTHGTHTDNIRVRMIMEAFEDPSARRFITTPILKMALQFMAAHGGYRASAERLLSQAERWGVPLDTDAFNILLDCYVRKHDVRFFHKVLSKMRERCFYPDARTWLHFLRLVQRDDVRLQVEAAMFDLGLFDDPGTRRGVSIVTAGTLAHQALRAGETLPAFLDKQAARFGSSWLADEDGAAANAVLTEFFLFHSSAVANRYHDYRVLVDRLISERGGSRGAVGVLPASTLNLILEHCAQPHVRDWDTALWALDLATPATNPRDDSAVGGRSAVATAYRHLVDLCVGTRSPAALAAVVFYAVKERALSVRAARTAVAGALLGKARVGAGGDVDDHHAWWRAHAPQLLSRDMAATLRKNPVEFKAHAVRAIEVAIRDATAGYVPADRLVDVLRTARALDQLQDAATATSNDGDAVAERPALTIALVSVEDGEPAPRTQVRLDSAFDAGRMVLYNQHATPPWRKRGGSGEMAAGASSSKIRSSSSSSSSTQEEAGQEAKLASEATAAQDDEKSSGNHPLVQYLNSLH